MVLCYEAIHPKFSAELKYKKDNKRNTLPTKTPENKYEPYFINKWTNNEGGNRKFGGWKDEAFDRFAELRVILKKSRKGDAKKAIISMEKAVLLGMRILMGLEATTREAEVRNNRAKKRKRAPQTGTTKADKDKMLLEWNSDADSHHEEEGAGAQGAANEQG